MARKRPQLLWHHARLLSHVNYGPVAQARARDIYEHTCDAKCPEFPGRKDDDYHWESWMDSCYQWVADRVGFWPLFLAVGDDETARTMTGYWNQWSRIISYSKKGNTYRKPGEFPNRVMFSFDTEPERVQYLDYDYYHIVLNDIEYAYEDNSCVYRAGGRVSAREESWIMRPQWERERWLREALSRSKRATSIQAVTSEIDLRTASRIWVRSVATAQTLSKAGFDEKLIEVVKFKKADFE